MIVHKGPEPLGISIVSGENGGIFVSKVTGGSIAHQAGLEYGDQLLEVKTQIALSSLTCRMRANRTEFHLSFFSSTASTCEMLRNNRLDSSLANNAIQSPSWPSTTHTCTSWATTLAPGSTLVSIPPHVGLLAPF